MNFRAEQFWISYGAVLSPPSRALGFVYVQTCRSQRRLLDDTEATRIPHVLFDNRTGVHGDLGLQAVARGEDDYGRRERSVPRLTYVP